MNNTTEHSSIIDKYTNQSDINRNIDTCLDTFGVIETCFDCIMFSLENNDNIAQCKLDYTVFMDMIYQTVNQLENINIYKDGISLYNFIFAKLSIIFFQYDIFDINGQRLEYQIFDSMCNKGFDPTKFSDVGFNISIVPLFFPGLDVKKIYADSYYYPLRFICLLLIENRISIIDDEKHETYKLFLKFCIDILYRMDSLIGCPSFCVHIIDNNNIEMKMYIGYDQYVFNNINIFVQYEQYEEYEQYINYISEWITNNTRNIIMNVNYSSNYTIIE